uniref:Uncharacterized protein n=1 Tax=Rhizophagus irregularis (strain DAOM 181602 / DAOM 197198 / MUCL 43194) TaxID=747089 RepID=U9TXL2_RHIID
MVNEIVVLLDYGTFQLNILTIIPCPSTFVKWMVRRMDVTPKGFSTKDIITLTFK